jgi:hypothetical protein
VCDSDCVRLWLQVRETLGDAVPVMLAVALCVIDCDTVCDAVPDRLAVVVCVLVVDAVCVGENDEQTSRSAATAAAESAVLNIRALETEPCQNSAPLPSQPMLTRGFVGVASAVSVQLFTSIPST